jgi:hypothetical protein
MTAADHGKAVAMDIGMGLMATDPIADGRRMRGVHGTTAPDPPNDFMDAFERENHVGHTWAEIVGMANIMQMRITSTTGTEDDTDPVPAASIDGQPTSSVTATGALVDTGLEDGMEHAGNYMGIPGTVFCAGTDCGVKTDTLTGNTLTGSWYFTPEDEMEWYVRDAADTDYEPETLYVRYGYWLDADGNNTAVNTYAMTGGNTGSLSLGEAADMSSSATYKGMAAGMSLRKEFDPQGEVVDGSLQSAAFIAAVALEATFGAEPILSGKIKDFVNSDGDPIDSGWEVVLLRRSFTGGNFVNGATTATGQDGVWTAQAYGAENERPEGVFGGFNAHFTNGHVAGAYETREE